MHFNKRIVCLLIVTHLSATSILTYAQILDVIGKRNSYYIDINQAQLSNVFEIQDGLLSLQYHDKHGRSKNLALKVYNWKREVVAQFELQKTYGQNYFNIQLDNDMVLENDRLYSCEISNEVGNTHTVLFKPVAPIKNDPPFVNILINPIHFKCDDPSGNNIAEFYGEIKNGKPPYTVNWYVMNNTRTDFLYQPKNEIIPRPGFTSVIHVDKDPEYYVLLLVKDACGAENRQMVHLICEDKNKKINTIFVEPLRTLPGIIKGKQ